VLRIARDLVLIDRPDHQLIEHVIASGIELDGLAGVPVFFSMVRSSAVTFRVYLPFFWSAFLSWRATVEKALRLSSFQQGELVVIGGRPCASGLRAPRVLAISPL